MTTTTPANPTKAYKGIAMEGLIAKWYTKTARRDTEFKKLVSQVSEAVPAGSRVLEVAPGPGFLAIEIAPAEPVSSDRPGYQQDLRRDRTG
jgi:hypothetical protein